MDEILLLLLRKGAHIKPLRLTTSEIGAQTGMSQQNASRKLLSLEEGGYIDRSKEGIRLTKKAYDDLATDYVMLKAVFEGKKLDIEGRITTGLGEGGFYVSLEGYRKQIKEKLGFDPYPGTLNITMDESWRKQHLLQLEPVIISGFRDKERTYGDLFAYPCRIGSHTCAIIVPLRTHHGPEILEIISPLNLKKELNKKDGDHIRVSV